MRLDRRAAPARRIGLTPLIDVVFILLVFFMLAADLQQWRVIGVEAAATHPGGGGPATAVSVRVRAGCGLDLDGTAVGPDRLAARLEALARREPPPAVTIRSEAGVPLQCLVTVLDRVRSAGLPHVSLVGRQAP